MKIQNWLLVRTFCLRFTLPFLQIKKVIKFVIVILFLTCSLNFKCEEQVYGSKTVEFIFNTFYTDNIWLSLNPNAIGTSQNEDLTLLYDMMNEIF